MDVIAVTSHGDCCRLCASRGHLFSVFEVRDGMIIRDLIFKHLNISINENDSLSSKMCEACKEKIFTFHEYFEVCSRVQDWFMKWILNDTSSKSTSNNEYDFVSWDTVIKDEIVKVECVLGNNETVAQFDDRIPFNNTSHCHNENATYLNRESPENYKQVVNIICDDSLNQNIDSDCSDDSAVPLSQLSKIPKIAATKRKYQGNCSEHIDFHCSVCNLECKSWYRLKNHSTQIHKVKPVVKCMLCKVQLKSKTVMYKHVAEHKNPSVYKCDKCHKITKSFVAFIRHKERHIPKAERLYHCELCPKTNKTKEGLQSHMLSHVPIQQRKIFPCDICKLKFTKNRSMLSHKRTVHEKIKSYMCDICGYTCATGPELRQHRAIHSEEKQFVCKVCSKGFKTDSNLKTHMDTHEGTSYQCRLCDKVLNTRRTFRKHQLVHEVERKFACSFCNIAFKRRQTLQAHLNSHTGDKPIACKWCKERFMYWASYHNHKRRHHPDKLNSVDSKL